MLTAPVTLRLNPPLATPFKRSLGLPCEVLLKTGAHAVSPTQGNAMSRRPHPYFGHLNRGGDEGKVEPGRRAASEPLVSARDEPGILWDAFRKEQ